MLKLQGNNLSTKEKLDHLYLGSLFILFLGLRSNFQDRILLNYEHKLNVHKSPGLDPIDSKILL